VFLGFSDAFARPVRQTAAVESFQYATCGNALSVPVRLVELPAGLHWSLLDCHHVNPPLLDPGTHAIDESVYGRD
jgi:hypothetical protein